MLIKKYILLCLVQCSINTSQIHWLGLLASMFLRLLFCLDDLSIGDIEVFTHYQCLWVNMQFKLQQCFFYKVEGLTFWVQILRIEMSSWQIFPFMSVQGPYLYPLIYFGLKSILLDIKMVTLATFLGSFDLNTFFQPFTLRQRLSLMLKCVSWMQQNNGSCL